MRVFGDKHTTFSPIGPACVTLRQLADRGRVLFGDLGPNGHTTNGFDFGDAYRSDTDLGDILLDGREATATDIIFETEFGFDLLPSSNALEDVEKGLAGAMQGSVRVKKRVVDPLLGDAYDYMVFNCPAYLGMLNNNALVATGNVVIPFEPEASSIGGYQRTMERLIDPAREFIDAEVLAVVPNKIDQRTEDRELLENLNTAMADANEDVPLHDVVPSFARITADELEAIGAGEVRPPKSGIRHRTALSLRENQPLQDYDPENDQLEHYDELAEVVVNGEVR